MDNERIDSLHAHPIFICGHPKSGTTLVQSMLDSHPQLIVYPEESYFFRNYLPVAEGVEADEKVQLAEELLIHMFTWNQTSPPRSQEGFLDRDYADISFSDVKEAMRGFLSDKNAKDEGDILSSAVLAFGEVSGQLNEHTRYWVEKTPYNEWYVEDMFSFWPQAKCIHIIRDPRDNYLSYRRKHPHWSPEFFAENWNRFALQGLENQRTIGDDQYLIIRYEDLVKSPQESIRTLIDFLAIDYHEILLKPTRVGKSWWGNSMFNDKFQEISDDPVGRWHGNLSSLAAGIIMAKSGEGMSAFGYDYEVSVDFMTQLRLVTWPIRKRIEYVFRKI